MIHGVINVYKEKGYTSHDVVAKLRGILRQKRIGHTGTLDPDAEGVLPVCLGNGTKLVERLTDKTKEYVCRMRLGIVTDTDDLSGRVIRSFGTDCADVRHDKATESIGESARDKKGFPTAEAVRAACLSFTGTYAQIPPMYSAIRQGGKKLYELARAGQSVERKAREVTIRELTILDIEDADGHPSEVCFRVTVSKGTYIRALCRDIGEKLGCGATMADLIRTRSGEFTKDESHTLREIEEIAEACRCTDPVGMDEPKTGIRAGTKKDPGMPDGTKKIDRAGFTDESLKGLVIPVEHFYEIYPAYRVRPEAGKLLDNGNPLGRESLDAVAKESVRDERTGDAETTGASLSDRSDPGSGPAEEPAPEAAGGTFDISCPDDLARIYDTEGRFRAVYRYDETTGEWKAHTIFPL